MKKIGTLNGEEVAIKRVLDMDEKKGLDFLFSLSFFFFFLFIFYISFVAKTFLREINTMSRLQHPNITVLVGVAVSSDDCYLLTEYVQRGSLFDLIHSKRRKVSHVCFFDLFF